MARRILFLLMALSLFPAFANARAGVRWLEKTYNYGAFREEDGPRKGSVRFVNEGPDTTFVSGARPSCGCTGVDYTREMIAPGDTATVTFVYDPRRRPGAFEKTVKVFLGKDREMHVIRLAGTVIGSATTLEAAYPVKVGPLRLETLTGRTGEIKQGASRHVFINAYNQSSDTITPEWKSCSPGMEIKLTPRSIPPGEMATFGFYIMTSANEQVGPVSYDVELFTGASGHMPGDTCRIAIKSVIVSDTGRMTVSEIDNGPRAYLLPEFVDLGEIGDNGTVPFSFELLNDGKSNLKVQRVYSADKNVRIKKSPSEVKPGKKKKIEGTLDIRNLEPGAFRINIEVMTNDGLHPVRTARLVGERR